MAKLDGNRYYCLDQQVHSWLEGDAQHGVTVETDPSPQSALVVFSSRSRC
jgi:hypothetical protein